jgi:hypothetical protein
LITGFAPSVIGAFGIKMSFVLSIGSFAGLKVKKFKSNLNGKDFAGTRFVVGWFSLILVPIDLDYEWSTGAKIANKR